MTLISIKTSKTAPKASADSITIYAVSQDGKEPKLVGAAQKITAIKNLNLKALQISGSAEATARIPLGNSIVGFIGIASELSSTARAREIGGAIGRAFNDQKTIVLNLPIKNAEVAQALVEGIAIVQYDYNLYKSSASKPMNLKNVVVVANFTLSKAQIDRTKVLSDVLKATRDLVNAPGNDLYPAKMADQIRQQSKIPNVKVEIWDEKRLAKEKCTGILSVGQGSARPPRLVKISYSPPRAKAKLALVGKGITFDTGGISLKPATGILGMKYDMAGAATVAQAAFAIARLKLPVAVTAYMCIAENMPSGSATRPNDVVTFRNGKSVEITNTDAEGRLVLADGLILASETKPDLIVDVATLTGAARVALGNRYTGLMGDDSSVDLVKKAADAAGELVWHMPLPTELFELIKSDIADLMNSRVGNPSGGMLVGGLFLQEFIGLDKTKERLPWAHLDFATAANNDLAPYGYTVKGATGAMVRTLVSVAEQLASKQKK
ncbi:MAG: hypothetical protein RL523_28 [Actinomycetota bacterium]